MYSSQNRTRVPIPPGFPVGKLIGKGGSNIKQLQEQTGCRIFVQDTYVDVSGSNSQRAVELLRAQLSSSDSSFDAYPHPLRVSYVLDADDPSAHFQFTPESSSGPKTYYCLKTLPASSSAAAAASDIDALSQQFAYSSRVSRPSQSSMVVHLKSDTDRYWADFLQAGSEAAGARRRFDKICVRFQLGKQRFYPPKGRFSVSSEVFSLAGLGSLRIDHKGDLKSEFGTSVAPDLLERLEARLQKLGLSAEEKTHCSVHLHFPDDAQALKGAVIGLRVDREGGGCVVRKIKSSSHRMVFCSVLHNESELGLRLKMLGQYHMQPPSPSSSSSSASSSSSTSTSSSSSASPVSKQEQLWAVARSYGWDADQQRGRSRLVSPSHLLSRFGFREETVRVKHKRVFSSPDCDVIVTMTQIFDEEGQHWEVGGTSRHLQEALRSGGRVRREWLEDLKRLVEDYILV